MLSYGQTRSIVNLSKPVAKYMHLYQQVAQGPSTGNPPKVRKTPPAKQLSAERNHPPKKDRRSLKKTGMRSPCHATQRSACQCLLKPCLLKHAGRAHHHVRQQVCGQCKAKQMHVFAGRLQRICDSKCIGCTKVLSSQTAYD